MKKILALSVLLLFCSALFAQATASSADSKDSKDMKNFRFGGTVLPSMFWYKPDNLKKFDANGALAKFGVLINGEFSSASGKFAFGFGVGIASSGGKMAFTDSTRYFFNDDAIISLIDTIGLKNKYSQYKLNNRTYNASYFIVPLSIKMRTNEIGYMRYFFQPGVTVAICKKVRANDDLSTLPATWPKTPATSANSGQSANQTNLDITKDMSPIRFSATISAGGEYYISGSTAVVFSIGYDYGLTNVVKGTSKYLLRTDNTAVPQKFIQSGVVLTV